MNMLKAQKIRRDTKRVFFKKGTCSRTFFYILDREFGRPLENEERAADPLAGGILQQGYQCGMLWGAALAAGAESWRRCGDRGRASAMAVKATRHIMASFVDRAKSADCLDITRCNFSSKASMAKYLLTGKFWSCFKLAEKWAPEAIRSAREGLALAQDNLPEQPLNCAAETVGKMGGGDQEMVLVAGFAGGLGLSGGGCGALSAAIWMTVLAEVRKQDWKPAFSDPRLERMLNAFYEASDYEMECAKITGRRFKTLGEHAEFISNGGCAGLIRALTRPLPVSTVPA